MVLWSTFDVMSDSGSRVVRFGAVALVSFAAACGDGPSAGPADAGPRPDGAPAADAAAPDAEVAVAIAGITVSAAPSLTTAEAGDQATFTLVLDAPPTADVAIPISSDDESEGTASPAVVLFTAADWDVPQTVTVSGVDDAVDDDEQAYRVAIGPAVSDDPRYDGLDPADLAARNLDDDTAGIVVTPTSGLLVSEFLDEDEFAVVLTSEPLEDVTIALASDDETEGTIAIASLTFTADDWDVPQLVRITGVDDVVADPATVFHIVTEAAVSLDAKYDGMAVDDVEVTCLDNDEAGVFVKARRKQFTSEGGQTTTIRVRLTTQPAADVTCPVASSDPQEGTVAVSSLTFTPLDFDTFKSVVVTGVDDSVIDGDREYTIVFGACASDDPVYDGFDPRDPVITNRDND
jgi:large repetitive protein